MADRSRKDDAVNSLSSEIDLLKVSDMQTPKSKRFRPILSRILEFPTEIRLMIFAICVTELKDIDSPNKEPSFVPGLLPALRPHKRMYEEALGLYYKNNWLRLTRTNMVRFQTLKDDTIRRIRRLMIYLGPYPDWTYLNLFTHPRSRFWLATNISTLRMEIIPGIPAFYSFIPMVARNMPNMNLVYLHVMAYCQTDELRGYRHPLDPNIVSTVSTRTRTGKTVTTRFHRSSEEDLIQFANTELGGTFRYVGTELYDIPIDSGGRNVVEHRKWVLEKSK